ncbi:Altered inheritance of mitochondria protein 32 [Onygenales sp. PD_12]|nr:Altered inheritance of mitochondria protein 32 [Onygenales sp. PD_12]
MPRTNRLPNTLILSIRECASPTPTRLTRNPTAHLSSRLASSSSRAAALSRRISIPPPFPVTSTCPEPSCSCAPTPAMPDGLEIDHAQNLNGTMAAYSQQVLISTGRGDWRSRIEEDGVGCGWGELARGLKGLVGRGGGFADPYNNILITNSSFAPHQPMPTTPSSSTTHTASALLFPSFTYLPTIPLDKPSLTNLVRAFLLPTTPHPAHNVLPAAQKATMSRVPALQPSFENRTSIQHSPTILICGHGHRDQRCGIMGPLLRDEFRRVLRDRGFSVRDGGDSSSSSDTGGDAGIVDGVGQANVGLISHIGGHKYAGNVIIYLPPALEFPNATEEDRGVGVSLRGKGVWYGRVEPRHVEGIVEETVLGGRVVRDHFRGGVGGNGEILRL